MTAVTAAPRVAAADGMGPHPWKLELGGYAELGMAYFDHGADDSREGGALSDNRIELDATRFVTELEGTWGGLEFEAELEVEHGGTGAEKEVEFDEFGEFEQDVEKGGEVQLEEFNLKKSWGRYTFGVGRFYVALGELSRFYRPTDYLGSTRSETEETLLGGQWDEMGAFFVASWPRLRVTAQLVNGLDSTGFSSKFWVSSGHQGAFELIRASSPAAAARVDFIPRPGVELGLAGYVGGTNRNRPKPDLINATDCSDPDTGDVAPCGFKSAVVSIGEAHAHGSWGGFRGQAVALFGHLSGAKAISDRNLRLSNELGVARTPVADNALGISAEAGYDLAPHLGVCPGNAIEPFLRFDYVDTMVHTRADLFYNPRFARTVIGAGVAYTWQHAVTGKLEVSNRSFGTDDIRDERFVRLTAGFIY